MTDQDTGNKQTPAKAASKKRGKIRHKDVAIAPFEMKDLHLLPQLMKDCLGRECPESWLKWKVFDSPYKACMMFMSAYYGDRLVGFIGANPVPFSLDGEMSLVYQHQDTAIHEDARDLRLLLAMIQQVEDRAAEAGGELTYSITAPHLRTLVTKRMGYKVVWENLKMVKLISLRGYVSKATRSKKLAALVPGPLGRSWKAPSSMSGEIVQIDEFDNDFDTFWEAANVPSDKLGRVFPWQDSKWLNYKFCQDELVNFLKFKYVENGEIIGYLVLNVTTLDVRIGYIDSLWTVPGRDDVIELLADFGIHQFQREKCDQISCWTRTDAPVGLALADRGFVQRPTAQCISTKRPTTDGELGLEGSHWNLQRGHTYYTSLGHLSGADGAAERPAMAKAMRDEKRREELRKKSSDS